MVDGNLLRYQEELSSPSLLQTEPCISGDTTGTENEGGAIIGAEDKVEEDEMEITE